MSQRFPLLLAVLCTRYVDAVKQPGAAAGLSVATETQHLWDFLSHHDLATCGQGPGRELCQHPLLLTVGYCSLNRCTPVRQPSAEACGCPSPPSPAPSYAPGVLAGVPGLPVPCHGAGGPAAPAAHHLGRAGHLGPRPSQTPGYRGGWRRQGGVRGGADDATPGPTAQGVEDRGPAPHNMAAAARERLTPHASRPAPHPPPRACAAPPPARPRGLTREAGAPRTGRK